MSEARAPGRPRSTGATLSILEAAAELLAEVGVDRFTAREVIARSGASSATVYRRWRSKEALLLDVLRDLMGGAIPEPPHVSLADDVDVIVHGLVALLQDGPVGAALPQLLRAARTSDQLSGSVEHWMAGRRAVVERMLRIAVDRGEARPDLSVEHGPDLLSGPIYYRFMVAGDTLDERWVSRHIQEFLGWAGAGAGTATPAAPPPPAPIPGPLPS